MPCSICGGETPSSHGAAKDPCARLGNCRNRDTMDMPRLPCLHFANRCQQLRPEVPLAARAQSTSVIFAINRSPNSFQCLHIDVVTYIFGRSAAGRSHQT